MGYIASGTYASSNGDFSLRIDSSDDSNGAITGAYTANVTPQGPFSVSLTPGTASFARYAFVGSKIYYSSSTYPCLAWLCALRRPMVDGVKWPYEVVDCWNGVYKVVGGRHQFVLKGTRSYLQDSGSTYALTELGYVGLTRP